MSDEGKDQAPGHDETTGLDDNPGQRPEQSDAALSGFTEAQLAELQGMFTSQGQPRMRGRLRGWMQRSRERAASFVHDATPPDEETEFDEDTFTGWLAARTAKHRGVAAVLALVSIIVIGGLWVMILGGDLALNLVGVVLVVLLGAWLVLGLLFRRRRK